MSNGNGQFKCYSMIGLERGRKYY